MVRCTYVSYHHTYSYARVCTLVVEMMYVDVENIPCRTGDMDSRHDENTGTVWYVDNSIPVPVVNTVQVGICLSGVRVPIEKVSSEKIKPPPRRKGSTKSLCVVFVALRRQGGKASREECRGFVLFCFALFCSVLFCSGGR